MAKVEVGFEEKLRELEALVLEIESGDLSLNEATKKFAEAKSLGDELQEMLGVTKLKIEEELEDAEEEE
jgi:exodeoxyribonuclease VII small subunit